MIQLLMRLWQPLKAGLVALLVYLFHLLQGHPVHLTMASSESTNPETEPTVPPTPCNTPILKRLLQDSDDDSDSAASTATVAYGAEQPEKPSLDLKDGFHAIPKRNKEGSSSGSSPSSPSSSDSSDSDDSTICRETGEDEPPRKRRYKRPRVPADWSQIQNPTTTRCDDLFAGVSERHLSLLRGCWVSPRIREQETVIRMPHVPAIKWNINWDYVMNILWSLNIVENEATEAVLDPGITNQNLKNRLGVIIVTTLRGMVPLEMDYFPLLNFLLWLYRCNIVTSKQILWIMLDVCYLSLCEGPLFMLPEDDILSIVLWHIATHQKMGWYRDQLVHVIHMKLCPVTVEYCNEFFSMAAQRASQIDSHNCHCIRHRCFPPMPGPKYKPVMVDYEHVLNAHVQCGNYKPAWTDKRYVDILKFYSVMYMLNVPCPDGLAIEELITEDENFQHHRGFSSIVWNNLRVKLSEHYPLFSRAQISTMMEHLNTTKLQMCPCSTHITLRGGFYNKHMEFPIQWYDYELNLMLPHKMVLNYSLDKTFVGDLYNVNTEANPKIEGKSLFACIPTCQTYNHVKVKLAKCLGVDQPTDQGESSDSDSSTNSSSSEEFTNPDTR